MNPYAERWKRRLRPDLLILIWAWFFLWHGYSVGPSDDEAYYWVLAQRPSLGYAFHPPAVAWSITFFQGLLGPFWKGLGTLVFRFPALIWSMLILFFGLRVMRSLRAATKKDTAREAAGLLVLLGLPGVFGLSWMMVPDLPLYCGVMGLLYFVVQLVQQREIKTGSALGLVLFSALSVFSKFSGILAIVAAAAVLLNRQVGLDRQLVKRAFFLLGLGLVLGLIPTILWNAQHDWGALRYQFFERHLNGQGSGLEINFSRGFRSLLIQLLAIGPLAVFGSWYFAKGLMGRDSKAVVLLPFLALHSVFLVQPFFSDFKPHWAFVFWLFIALYEGIGVMAHGWQRRHTVQGVYSLLLVGLAIWACHDPWIGKLIHRFNPGLSAEQVALLDVSNDLYGWEDLPKLLPDTVVGGTVVGGRYQTAAQASFALRKLPWIVTLLPRDSKAHDEWPASGVTEDDRLAPLKIVQPFFYVTDLRYSAPPQFLGVACELYRIASLRRGIVLSKKISVFQCTPAS